MGRKERNRQLKSHRELPAEEKTTEIPVPLVIRPLAGNRRLLIASFVMLSVWLAMLGWLAWQR